jgi:hypothetical protein
MVSRAVKNKMPPVGERHKMLVVNRLLYIGKGGRNVGCRCRRFHLLTPLADAYRAGWYPTGRNGGSGM